MKTLIKTLLCGIGLTLVPLALTASNEQTSTPEVDLKEMKIEASVPKAIHRTFPQINSRYEGLELLLKFTVNENGKPVGIHVARPLIGYGDVHTRSFAVQMEQALRNWKFEPAINTNGQPVATKVQMPVKIAKRGENPVAIVSLKLDTPNPDKS